MRRPAALCLLGFALGTLGCDQGDASASKPRRQERSSQLDKRWWQGCRADADCRAGHACIRVDRRPKPATMLANQFEPMACALIAPNDLVLEDVLNDLPRYLDQLLVFRKAMFVLESGTKCKAVECLTAKGEPVDCCATCEDGVALSGFDSVIMTTPDGEPVDCKPRRDCEPHGSGCPSWLRLGTSREIAGAFTREHGHAWTDRCQNQEHLAFLLASDIEPFGPDKVP